MILLISPNINFDGHCLIKNNILIPEKVIKLYISYTLGSQSKNFNLDFKLSNCSFGSVKLTKNTDLGKCKYTGYGIGFDSARRIFFIWRKRRLDSTTFTTQALYPSNLHNQEKDLY